MAKGLTAWCKNQNGMAQSFGYIVAAIGPVTMGSLFDITESWIPPLIFLSAMVVVNIISSQLSARERYLFDNETAQIPEMAVFGFGTGV